MNNADGTNLANGLKVLDVVTGLAAHESDAPRLIMLEARDGSELTSFERASTAANLLNRSRHAPQWQGLAKMQIASMVKLERKTATLYIIVVNVESQEQND